MIKSLVRLLSKKSKKASFYPVSAKSEISKIRNIGIIAHIDSGKTTLTERLLFYSGSISEPGGVDEGTTVTDYLEQERERGITIRAASVSFNWSSFHINLIDTPGHVDFTADVDRSLRVMDGSIIVVDASNGIQPQTLTVWNQSDRYHLPRMFFINKLDHFSASIDLTVHQIKEKLKAVPLVLQEPLIIDHKISGYIDLVNKEALLYNNPEGTDFSILKPENFPEKYKDSFGGLREKLLESLASIDDEFAEAYLSGSEVSDDVVRLAIRKNTIHLKGFPVMCGSALKNRNIHGLLEGIVQYLPSPGETHPETAYLDDKAVQRSIEDKKLSGVVYKVMNTPMKGDLTYFRIYSGGIKQGETLKNTSRKNCLEKATRIYRIYGNEYQEVKTLKAGDIAAIAGLKETRSGDTLIDVSDPENIVFPVYNLSPNVFFCSIGPEHEGDASALENILKAYMREDPSLHAEYDEDTEQMIVSGQGELQLEILKDRILRDYKMETRLGPIQVSYRETVQKSKSLKYEIKDEDNHLHVIMEIVPEAHEIALEAEEALHGDRFQELHGNFEWSLSEQEAYQSFISNVDSKLHELYSPLRKLEQEKKQEIEKQILLCLQRGPQGYPMINTKVRIIDGYFLKKTSIAVLRETVTKCFRQLVKEADPILMEPLMKIELHTPQEFLGDFLNDISANRNGSILQVQNENESVISATIPLGKIMGYSSISRSISKGQASFSLGFHSFEKHIPD